MLPSLAAYLEYSQASLNSIYHTVSFCLLDEKRLRSLLPKKLEA